MWVFHYKQLWEQCARCQIIYTKCSSLRGGQCEYRISSIYYYSHVKSENIRNRFTEFARKVILLIHEVHLSVHYGRKQYSRWTVFSRFKSLWSQNHVFKPELRPRTQNYFLRRWRVCLEAIAKEQVPFYAAYSWASEDGTFPGVDAFYDEDISDKLSVCRSATAKPCSGSRHFFSRFRDRSTTSCHKVIFWMGTTYDRENSSQSYLAYLGNPIKFWTSINLLVKTHPLAPFI